MAEPNFAPQSAYDPSRCPAPEAGQRPPAAAEGGRILQCQIGQSAELQSDFTPPPAAPPPAGLDPEALARQIDPATGLTIGEVRIIDRFVEDVETLLAPWQSARQGDLRFDTRPLEGALDRFRQTFIQVHPQHLALHQAPRAEAELERCLHRGHIPRYLEEIHATKSAVAAPGLASFVAWLGLEGQVQHTYVLRGLGNRSYLGGKLVFTGLLVQYRGGLLPGWLQALGCVQGNVGIGAGEGAPTELSLPSTPLETTSFNFIHPDEAASAWIEHAQVGVAAGPASAALGLLRLHMGEHTLTFDLGTDGVEVANVFELSPAEAVHEISLPNIGVSTGGGRCEGPGALRQAPRAVEPVHPAPLSTPVTPIHLSVRFEVGQSALMSSGHAALEALVLRLLHIHQTAPGAQPLIDVEGRASAEWQAARDGLSAHLNNEALAVERAEGVKAALEDRLQNAGLPARVARSMRSAASVGQVEGEAADREVIVTVTFDLSAPRNQALGAAA